MMKSFMKFHRFTFQPPPPPIIFEGLNLPQQTINHWKGNLSETPIHLNIEKYSNFITL